MGWNFARCVAKRHEVHVLVGNGFEDLEAYLKSHPEEARHITIHHIPRYYCHWLEKVWPPSYYYTYERWHRDALAYAAELDAREHFDLVHQVNLAGYRSPGFLWKLGKPLVWGPLGGLNNTPWLLLPSLGVRDALFLAARNVLNSFQKRWGYAANVYARRAGAVFASTEAGAEEVRSLWGLDADYICEVGVSGPTRDAKTLPGHRPGTPLKVAWVGVFEARKALPVLFAAAAQCPHPLELHIIGTGSKAAKWRRLAAALPGRHQAVFHGSIPHSEVFEILNSCHVFSITSVRDDTSSVLMEALSMGLPIIAPDHCGFASVVNETCGIKLPLSTYGRYVADYAAALAHLAETETHRARLAEGALARSSEYSWERKMQKLEGLYAKAVERFQAEG